MAKNKKDDNGGPLASAKKKDDGTPRRLNGKAFKKKPKVNPVKSKGTCGYTDEGIARLAEKKGIPVHRVVGMLEERQKTKRERHRTPAKGRRH